MNAENHQTKNRHAAADSAAARGWRRLLHEQRGAVNMEYVILAVLIAAACVLAVVVFSRAVVTSFLSASKGATMEHTAAHDDLVKRRLDREADMQKAKQYHDSMHQ